MLYYHTNPPHWTWCILQYVTMLHPTCLPHLPIEHGTKVGAPHAKQLVCIDLDRCRQLRFVIVCGTNPTSSEKNNILSGINMDKKGKWTMKQNVCPTEHRDIPNKPCYFTRTIPPFDFAVGMKKAT